MKRAAPPDLERAALRLAEILGAEGLLVGGLAVGAHGFVRATRDVDFVARIPLAEVRALLRRHGIAATLHRGDPSEGDFPCVRGTLGGVPFDVLPPLVPLEWERAIDLDMAGGRRLRVVGLEGLIRLKLRAHGPKDLMDVAALVMRHPDCRRMALDAAESHGVAERLEPWLEDPRLRAEVTSAQRAERSRERKKVSRKGR